MQPKQHDPRRRRMPVTKNQLAEIVVERQKHAVLIDGSLQNDWVRPSRQTFCRVHHVVALDAQRLSNTQRKILIG